MWVDAENSPFSYGEVGATSGSDLPAGYRHDRRIAHLGTGPDPFDGAVAALRAWGMHAQAGMRIFPEGPGLAPELTVLVVVRFGPLTTVAPCRVVYVVEEADRFGFAYGTLPGHPERGEEAFVVERDDQGAVRLTVSAFSRPTAALARLGGPVSRRFQERATTAYLDAMGQLTGGDSGRLS